MKKDEVMKIYPLSVWTLLEVFACLLTGARLTTMLCLTLAVYAVSNLLCLTICRHNMANQNLTEAQVFDFMKVFCWAGLLVSVGLIWSDSSLMLPLATAFAWSLISAAFSPETEKIKKVIFLNKSGFGEKIAEFKTCLKAEMSGLCQNPKDSINLVLCVGMCVIVCAVVWHSHIELLLSIFHFLFKKII
ncbi:MAG: hypothetical protein E7496_06880 [Ruminococcus sp.]|nr:hypothetical protein [Ruminococcus sp.]